MIPALTGILAPHGLATSFESIATVTVGAGGSSTMSFSSISTSTYTHLQVRVFSRSTSASTGGMWGKIQLNSDTTTSNYAQHSLYGNGSSAATTAYNANAFTQYAFYTAHQGDNSWGVAVIDILDAFNTSKYKTVRCLSGYDSNGGGLVMLSSELWMNTNAVTGITLDNTGANFAQYSTAALYGVKS